MNGKIKSLIEERKDVFKKTTASSNLDPVNEHRVLANIRMSLFERLKLKQLPTEDQAILLCGDDICHEIDRALTEISLHRVKTP